jgi:hypothetical protein
MKVSKEFGKFVLILTSLVIGIWHFGFALKALFVFRPKEPLSMWIIILAGPLSTLPAVLVSFIWIRIGGIWLVCGGLISLIALLFLEIPNKFLDVFQYALKFIGPMLLLGLLAFFARARRIWPYR